MIIDNGDGTISRRLPQEALDAPRATQQPRTGLARADIIRMAQEAGFYPEYAWLNADRLIRFAALVSAAEREACAKVCDFQTLDTLETTLADVCAADTRARGEL